MTDEGLVARLEDRAQHYAREAERYRIAAEVARAEMRRSSGAADRPRGEPADPRGSSMAMVEMVVTETNRPWRVDDLTVEMHRRGWQTSSGNPANTARSAAHRLAKQGRIQRLSDGTYAAKSTATVPIKDAQPDEVTDDPGAATPPPPPSGLDEDEEPPFLT